MASRQRPPTAYAALADRDWIDHLRALNDLDEVNFWQPSAHGFAALRPGEPFIFKAHARDGGQAVGVGFFVRYTPLPVSMAWEAFGIKNGATSLLQMRERIRRYRRPTTDAFEDYVIGCIILSQPLFFAPSDRFMLTEWAPNIQTGRSYNLAEEPGRSLWLQFEGRIIANAPGTSTILTLRDSSAARYGAPIFVQPRLGQGSFQTAVLDAYGRRCAITGERVVPVLEAAHIRSYSEGGEHRIDNGLLLRRDVHALFDRGYITVSPDLEVLVSRRLRTEFDNGEDYLMLHGSQLRHPSNPGDAPGSEFLDWHNRHRFVA